MKVFIHIGTHKAGSTTIQKYFSEIAKITDKRKFLYYEYGYTLATKIRDKQITPKMIPPMIDALEKDFSENESEVVFLSGESFIGDMHAMYEDTYRLARYVKELFQKFDVRFFVLFRQQPEFYESMYQQNIKKGYSYSFDEFLANVPWIKYNWDKILQEGYEKLFPLESIKAMPFELFYTEHNPLEILSEDMGIPYQDAIYKGLEKYNRSMSCFGLSLFRHFTMHVHDFDKVRKFRKLFLEEFPKDSSDDSFITIGLRKQMRKYFMDGNMSVARRYSFPEDWVRLWL